VAATAIFLRYGFKKTSMDEVARAAGVSGQGLYLYFDTKDLLFREALQHLMSHLISAARAAARKRRDAKQILNRPSIDLAWNSSRLEGNTYSLLDTKRLIELGEEAEARAHLEA
jgi:AcrR family transcriptional regulator